MESLPKEPGFCKLLQESFLFRGLPKSLAEEVLLSEGCEAVAFSPGEALYSPTCFRQAVALLAEGEAAAYKPHMSERIVLNTFGPGALFGVAAVFDPVGRYVACVEAKRPCKVLFLSQPLLEHLFEQDVLAAKNYICYLSGRIRYLNARIDGFTADSAAEKLALFLLQIFSSQKSNSFPLPCDMTRLAATLDLGRASLYRAFEQLDAEGIAVRKGRTVTILSPGRLQAMLPPQ